MEPLQSSAIPHVPVKGRLCSGAEKLETVTSLDHEGAHLNRYATTTTESGFCYKEKKEHVATGARSLPQVSLPLQPQVLTSSHLESLH